MFAALGALSYSHVTALLAAGAQEVINLVAPPNPKPPTRDLTSLPHAELRLLGLCSIFWRNVAPFINLLFYGVPTTSSEMGAKTAGCLISLGGFEIRNEHVPNLNISWTEKGALWFHKNMLLRLQIWFRWTFRTPILKTMHNWWVCGARIYYNPVKVMHKIWLFLTISTGWVYVEDNPSKVMHTIWLFLTISTVWVYIRRR